MEVPKFSSNNLAPIAQAAGQAYNLTSSRQRDNQVQQQQVRYLKHYLDLNSPRTQQAFLNLGLTADDILQKTKQQIADKNLSEEANEFKFRQYVHRVNEAAKKVTLERKELMKKAGLLSVDQVFMTGTGSMMRPASGYGNKIQKNYHQISGSIGHSSNTRTTKTLPMKNHQIQHTTFPSMDQQQQQQQYFSQQQIQHTQMQQVQPVVDVQEYQYQSLRHQGQENIKKQQDELKQFLEREKHKMKMLKKLESRIKQAEENKTQKIRDRVELARIGEQKRIQKHEKKRQQDEDFQRSMNKLRQKHEDEKSKILAGGGGSKEKNTMMSHFNHSASQLAIQQRIEESKSKRDKIEQEVLKKIECDKAHIIEQQLRSTFNHEKQIYKKIQHLQERSIKLAQTHEVLRIKGIHSELVNENKYLTKAEEIRKRREDQEKKFEEKAKSLRALHLLKREKYESHKREQKEYQLTMLQMQQEREQMHSTLGKSTQQLQGGYLQQQQFSQTQYDRRFLSSAGSSRGFSRERRELNMVKSQIIEENLIRERRKREWKKMNILAKEQLKEEKIRSQKEHQRMMLHSQDDMRKRQTIERDKISSTISQVKAAPFSPTAKKLVEKTLPAKAGKDIEAIYRDSSEERRKKKEEEKGNF